MENPENPFGSETNPEFSLETVYDRLIKLHNHVIELETEAIEANKEILELYKDLLREFGNVDDDDRTDKEKDVELNELAQKMEVDIPDQIAASQKKIKEAESMIVIIKKDKALDELNTPPNPN